MAEREGDAGRWACLSSQRPRRRERLTAAAIFEWLAAAWDDASKNPFTPGSIMLCAPWRMVKSGKTFC